LGKNVKKILRTFVLVVIAVILAIAGLAVLVQYPNYKRAKRDFALLSNENRLSSTLFTALKGRDGLRVDLGETIAIPWDRLFIVAPYTPLDVARKELPGEWFSRDHDNIDRRDDICVLAFFDGSHLAARLSVPRGVGDFANAVKNGGYFRKDAIFSMVGGRAIP
jgi:hypothetical protein